MSDDYSGRTTPQVSIKDSVMVADSIVINSRNIHLICPQCEDEGHITLSVCAGCEKKFCQKCKAKSKYCTQCIVAIKEKETEQKRIRRRNRILEQEKIMAQKNLEYSKNKKNTLRKESIIRTVKVKCGNCGANIAQRANQCSYCHIIFKENTVVNKTRNLKIQKNSEWDKKWLNPSMESYKLRKSKEEKQEQSNQNLVTTQTNNPDLNEDYSGHIFFTGLLIGVLAFSYINKDEWPGTFPVVLPISLIAYALAILSLYRPVRVESNKVTKSSTRSI